ncbi:hypothetical protein CTAYLR_005829 [Chrysophaeum taylorii]|uniref:Autophagy-related protein 3 n=1 Tax=Chrysophaeum taylorii TaxID=2483200 RepID=A0AAD7XQK7_9STRA|nr:hypothetical protein CTAYLR_005829 [Chrysophaeum taylorii]
MTSLLARGKEVRERWWPVLRESAFLARGVLTPEEFVAAGDELVYKCPTWSWSAGDEVRRKRYLPETKQFLVTTNVPCAERAAAMEGAVMTSADDEDDWVAPSLAKDVTEETIETIGEKTTEDDELAGLEDATISADEATSSADKILRTRTYDLSITYDKYWQTPRMWFFGYDENAQPLSQAQVFEDIILDYARRTVTFELHPHLEGSLHASIHPCKHPAAMKRILDTLVSKKDANPRPDQALFIFLKFLQSVVPTINYDFTQEVEV